MIKFKESKLSLSLSELEDKIKTRSSNFIELEKHHKLLLMHTRGIGLQDHLKQIKGHESDEEIKTRKAYTRSNRALFSSLLRPVDKIFSAKGSSRMYPFKNKSHEAEFIKKISNIKEGLSLTEWTQKYWKDKLINDPNGIFLTEHDGKKAYPTYKSISSIQEYSADGQQLIWVIFKPIEIDDQKHFRYYDGSGDYTFSIVNEKIKIVEKESFSNKWGYVPGFVISDIIDTLTGFKSSPIDNEIDLAEDFLLQGSIKNSYKFKQGFPITWMYTTSCKLCNGTGEYNGEKCYKCNGTGNDTNREVSEIKLIVPPEIDSPDITPIAGFISPELDFLRYSNEEILFLKQHIEFSHWNTTYEYSKNETATGRFIDTDKVVDRLHEYRKSIQNTERMQTKIIADYYYSDFMGSSIFYGTRYMIETPDQMLDKKIKAKEKGLDVVTQEYLNNQYYQSEFVSDPVLLKAKMKLHKLEPFPYMTLSEVEGSQTITQEDKKRKAYFSEWVQSLQDNDIYEKELKELDNLFLTFIKTKNNEMQSNL